MSDYGFATYDGTIRGRKNGIINSKYPIFGPKYNKIAKMYKTFHIIDNSTQSFSKITYTPPYNGSSYNRSSYVDYEKKCIMTFEHGLGYRPVGYVYFSGKIRQKVKHSVQQRVFTYNGWEKWQFGEDFGPITGEFTDVIDVVPNIKSQMFDNTGSDYTRLNNDGFSAGYNAGNIQLPQYCAWVNQQSGTGSWRWVQSSVYIVMGIRGSYIGWGGNPYVVEIDDKYIKLYRYVSWCYYRYRTVLGGNYDALMDLKGIEDYNGSEFDMTVYLCPYKMEDLLL